MMPSDGGSQLSLIYINEVGTPCVPFKVVTAWCNVPLFLACEVILLKGNRSVFQSRSTKLVIAFIIK